jgi:hypothetical protein
MLPGAPMTQGSETRVRSKHKTIRFSPEELAAVDAAAERAGLTPGSYARQVLLGAPQPRQVRRPPVERGELVRLLGLLGNVSNNINQLARVANFGDGIDRVDFKNAMIDLKSMRDTVLQALGRDT